MTMRMKIALKADALFWHPFQIAKIYDDAWRHEYAIKCEFL